MQTQDIISVNVWQILISLCNLAILFLILKKFLYQPVKKALARRQADLDAQYAKADEAHEALDAAKAVLTAAQRVCPSMTTSGQDSCPAAYRTPASCRASRTFPMVRSV